MEKANDGLPARAQTWLHAADILRELEVLRCWLLETPMLPQRRQARRAINPTGLEGVDLDVVETKVRVQGQAQGVGAFGQKSI